MARMDRIETWLEEERSSSEVRRKLIFEEHGATAMGRSCVDYIISGPQLPAPLERADIAVPALIFKAMRRAKPLHIRGPVSRTLLDNIYEFQAFWNFLLPEMYHRVDVTAESEVSGEPRYDGAVVPFSGGVDSTFTVWRHRNDRDAPGQRKIKVAFMVHGFDIPLDSRRAFDVALENSRATLDSVKLPLTIVRTNWKSATNAIWEMEFGAGVVSCAYNFAGDAGYCLFSAGPNYASFKLPWGENPVTMWMLSSHDFHIDFDGAAFKRDDKVATFADWREGVERLRVCWEAPVTGYNCGRCEKCVRTQLNFLACGRPVPPAFSRKAGFFDIAGYYTERLYRIEDNLSRALASGQSGAWVIALRFARFRSKYLPRPLWTVRQYARRIPWLRRLVKDIRARANGKQRPSDTT